MKMIAHFRPKMQLLPFCFVGQYRFCCKSQLEFVRKTEAEMSYPCAQVRARRRKSHNVSYNDEQGAHELMAVPLQLQANPALQFPTTHRYAFLILPGWYHIVKRSRE